MPNTEITPDDLRTILYSNGVAACFTFIVIILIIAYLKYYDILMENSVINYKYKTYVLLVMSILILFRTATEFSQFGEVFPLDDCELFEKDCPRCYPYALINGFFIFIIYFLILLYYFFEIFISIRFLENEIIKKIILSFGLLSTLVPLIFSFMMLNKMLNQDYALIIVPFGNMGNICSYNPIIYNYYDDLIQINNPYIFGLITFMTLGNCRIYYALYKNKLKTEKALNVVIKIFVRNILINILYILGNFLIVLMPQYILNKLPITGLEYIVTLLILLLNHPIGNMLYNLFFGKIEKRIISHFGSEEKEKNNIQQKDLSIVTE